jgi:hypothetical protein
MVFYTNVQIFHSKKKYIYIFILQLLLAKRDGYSIYTPRLPSELAQVSLQSSNNVNGIDIFLYINAYVGFIKGRSATFKCSPEKAMTCVNVFEGIFVPGDE